MFSHHTYRGLRRAFPAAIPFGTAGVTLIELIVTISVIGIIAAVSAPTFIDLLTSLWYTQGRESINQIGREVTMLMSDELRHAVEVPDSLRPWVDASGTRLRFHISENPADSIVYSFFNGGSGTFLYRCTGAGSIPGRTVPPYSSITVDYVKGNFSVDNGVTGFSATGKVSVMLEIGRDLGTSRETSLVEITMHCRNYD